MDAKIADFKEQLEILDVETRRLYSHLAALKEATKGDALAFEEKLREVVMLSEKNKYELDHKPRPLLANNAKLNKSFMSNASEHRAEGNTQYKSTLRPLDQFSESKMLDYKVKLSCDLEKIRAATGIQDSETLFNTLTNIEQENYKQLRNINELNTQIDDLDEQLNLMTIEKESLLRREKESEESTRFKFFASHLEEKEALENQINELQWMNNESEGRLNSQLKDLTNIFYTIGCDKAIDRSELKSDFLSKENLAEVLRIIENRMNEALFVYHHITKVE